MSHHEVTMTITEAAAYREAFNAMREVLSVIQAAPRTHPERNGATYWQYNLIPRTIERIDAALSLADKVRA